MIATKYGSWRLQIDAMYLIIRKGGHPPLTLHKTSTTFGEMFLKRRYT
jgi:hypothetical protein